MPKTFREIRQDRRQAMWEVAGDREDDKNVKLGPDKVVSDPSDPDEFDELEDDLDRTHTEVDAIRPIYVRDKLGQYTTAAGQVTSSGTMAQMMQQAATKNLQSEYMQEEVEEEVVIDENAMDTLKKIVAKKQAERVRLEDGSIMNVDMTTANALLAVHGALNVHNQKKMASSLNSGKAGFAKMSKFAFKQFGAPLGKLANAPVSEEEVEDIDELSKKTLANYIKGASQEMGNIEYNLGSGLGSPRQIKGMAKHSRKRQKGINTAAIL